MTTGVDERSGGAQSPKVPQNLRTGPLCARLSLSLDTQQLSERTLHSRQGHPEGVTTGMDGLEGPKPALEVVQQVCGAAGGPAWKLMARSHNIVQVRPRPRLHSSVATGDDKT